MGTTESEVPATPESINIHKDQIVEQNGRYFASGDLKNNRLLRIVQSDIETEQIDSFHNLLKTSLQVPYEVIGERALELGTMLEHISDDGIDVDDKSRARLGQLNNDVELAVQLAPRRAEDIKRIEAEEREKLRDKLLEQVRGDVEEAYKNLGDFGDAWPIPAAINPEDRALLYDMFMESNKQTEANEFTEDIIPITPEERIHQAEVAERAKRSIENPEASQYLTYYFAERVGEIVTVEQLARFLYVADLEGNNHRSHITTLLGPKIQGKRIQKLLHEEYGLYLQYGIRILKQSENGRLVERRRTRIYRAVESLDEASTGQVSEHNLDAEHIVWDVLEAVLPPQKELDTATIETIDEAETPSESVQEQPETEKQAEDWKVAFQEDVQATIERLVQDRIFDQDAMRGSTIRAMSSSTLLGTETNRNRLKDAGLMRSGEVKTDHMTREQRVIGGLFNRHPSILGQRSKRQREALQIIREMITANLGEVKDE